MFVDEASEELSGGLLLRQIVSRQFESPTFQVGYRFAAGRSGRFEVDLELLGHFFLTHQASDCAAGFVAEAAAVAYFGASSSTMA